MLTVKTKEKLNIHVIGAGGTGGYAVEYLTRLFAGTKNRIHVWDGDMVEIKNLKRQNFSFDDVDKNKATALVDRLNKMVHSAPTLIDHPAYITDKDEFAMDLAMDTESDESLVIVLAVDNIATRKMINEVAMDMLKEAMVPVIMLDSGNDDQGGQVVLYTNYETTYTPALSQPIKGQLPTMLQIFPELATISDDNPGLVMDCAENAEHKPQAMMCNVRNGEVLAGIVYQIYNDQQIPSNMWRSLNSTQATTSTFTGFTDKKEG